MYGCVYDHENVIVSILAVESGFAISCLRSSNLHLQSWGLCFVSGSILFIYSDFKLTLKMINSSTSSNK